MKIYTKTGDDGTTGLYGGGRVRKDDSKVSAYGEVDELNSFVGLLVAEMALMRDHDYSATLALLARIQNRLFDIGAELSCSSEKFVQKLSRRITSSDITELEQKIDEWDPQLLPLKNFILPGGHKVAAAAHICRAVCRRAERAVLHAQCENKLIIEFLNRLSDFFFVLARFINRTENVSEPEWEK